MSVLKFAYCCSTNIMNMKTLSLLLVSLLSSASIFPSRREAGDDRGHASLNIVLYPAMPKYYCTSIFQSSCEHVPVALSVFKWVSPTPNLL
jgi:hypothetical protein